MKITQFYPSVENEQTTGAKTFLIDPGGLFLKSKGELYSNEEEMIFSITERNVIRHDVETYGFRSHKTGKVVRVISHQLSDSTNLREVISKYMAISRTKIPKSKMEALHSAIESFNTDGMVNYALDTNDEKLFYQLKKVGNSKKGQTT